ncbi:MAG: TauD/TfdA family dioxygenase [Actinomycetota bacterium]
MSLRLARLSPAVGAVVEDVDLRAVDEQTAREINEAWADHGVLFFRGQHLEPDEQAEAARIFGEPEHFEMAPAVADSDYVHRIQTGPPRRHGGASRWHSDVTWKPLPPRGSMLQAVDLPPLGGDTLFASANGAFESLSTGLQRFVSQLTATHHGGEALGRAGQRVGREVPDPVQHPAVRRHPVTDRPCLYVNAVFTHHLDDVPRRESDALLPLLCDQFKDPELQCRFRWEPGDVAIWDNRAVQHYAAPDYDATRTMHRVVLAGEPVHPWGPTAGL